MGKIRISDGWKYAIFIIFLFLGVLFLSLFMAGNTERANEEHAAEKMAESPTEVFQTENLSESLFDVIDEQGNTAIVVFKPTGALYVSSRGVAALLVNEDGTPYTIIQLEEYLEM